VNAVSTPVAGAITVALIVGLGIFVYPWLMTQRRGRWIIALMTALLACLFIIFQGSGSSATSIAASIAIAGGLALAPVITAIIAARVQRK